MYFVPIALFIRDFAPPQFWSVIAQNPGEYASLTWAAFVTRNLVPVTIGNVIGGAGMVGVVYWFVYLRSTAAQPPVLRGSRHQPASR